MIGPAAAKQAGITYRQLDYWTRQGYLHAEKRNAQRSGYERDYSDEQIRRAWMMGHLVTLGLTPFAAYTAALQLAERGDGIAVMGRVLTLLWRRCELCDDLLAPGQLDVHDDCLDEEERDFVRMGWSVDLDKPPSRNVENVDDPEGRFS